MEFVNGIMYLRDNRTTLRELQRSAMIRSRRVSRRGEFFYPRVEKGARLSVIITVIIHLTTILFVLLHVRINKSPVVRNSFKCRLINRGIRTSYL